jgi:hypothetical protein
MTSFPRSERTSSTHLDVFMNEVLSARGRRGECKRLQTPFLSRPPPFISALLVHPECKIYPLVISYTTTATLESRIYEGIRERKRSCPAVSQSCRRTVRSSRYIVLDKKSIPAVPDLVSLVVQNREGEETMNAPMVAW